MVMGSGLKRFILWDYPRAGWQYDVMVGIILAFIFLTPREWFRDQPRVSHVVMLPSENGANVFWIDSDSLTGVAENERGAKASELIRAKSAKKENLIRLTPVFDAEEQIKGYMAYTRP